MHVEINLLRQYIHVEGGRNETDDGIDDDDENDDDVIFLPDCEMNIHPHCRNLVLEICSVGSLRKKQEKERRPTSVFEKIISRKPSMNIPLTGILSSCEFIRPNKSLGY